MQSLYGQVLKQSWQIIWHRKALWFLGILATLFAGSIEIELLDNLLTSGRNNFLGWQNFFQGGLFNSSLISRLQDLFTSDAASATIVLIIFILFLIILLAIVLIAVLSQMVIIDQASQYLHNAGFRPQVMDLARKNWFKLLPVTCLNILVKVAVFFAFLLAYLPLALTLGRWGEFGSWLYLLLFVILLPLAIIFSFIVKYIIAYIVVYGQSWRLATINAWRLFWQNWLVSIEMSFMLFLINIFASLAVVILIYVFSIPLIFLATLGSTFIAPIFFVVMYFISFVLFLIMFILGGGLITGYSITAWTTLFVRLNEQGGHGKIVRAVEKLSANANLAK